jgi:alpha-pyrone synthase
MNFALFGLGTAVPAGQLNQIEALACAKRLGGARFETANWLQAVYQRSEIDTRSQVLGRPLVEDLLNKTESCDSPFHCFNELGPSTAQRMAIYAEQAPALAVSAAQQALDESRFEPESITHLVTVSCTGFLAPGVDRALITELNLQNTVERVNVGFMGCHGAINGLRVVNAICGANKQARVLLVAVELCSLHYYYGNSPDKIVANALFADGAAALVGMRDPAAERWKLGSTGSCLIPGTAELMSWSVGDQGFEMTLARTIPGVIREQLRPWLSSWLEQHGVPLNRIKSWAIHPGGPRILEAVAEGLELLPEALAPSREVFRQYGNMSSPTVLFILQKLQERRLPRPCVMLGFGPGLTAEAALWV